MGRRVPQTQQPCVRPGEGWASPGCTLPKTHHAMTTHNHTIPDRSLPRSTRTVPSAVHQDGGVKCATGASSKIRGRDNITTGTWNTRTCRAAGKLQELTHAMDRYRWNILGLCQIGWKNFGDTTTEEGHEVFFSGKEDKHEHGVGFLVHMDIMNTLMGCRTVRADLFVCHHHHQSLNREGRWSTTDDFATSFLHFFLFSTALWDLPNSRPVHSPMLSSHLFLCPPCLLPPFTVSCKMVLARPDERETWPYHCSLRLFTIVRRSSCGPVACWIKASSNSRHQMAKGTKQNDT